MVTPTPIPGPKALPVIGNMLDVQGEVPVKALESLVDIYGPIFTLSFPGGSHEHIYVGGFDLFDELCDETRFYKIPPNALSTGASGARGLFGSPSEKDPDWKQAHAILMPAFGPLAIEHMFDEMHDIATQLVMKWARQGPQHRILLTDDFTRLTLDTIALCAMDFRFNSFYTESVHPFVEAMNHTLAFRSERGQISSYFKMLFPSYGAQLKKDVEYMKKVAEELVQYRREHPTDKKDLLNAMVYGKDPKTGESMRNELIAANMQTFLIAGHETTSGLLSFAFMNMLLNPSTYFTAQAEVDRALGKDKIEVRHLNQLPYLNAVLRETLRLAPTAPAFARGVRPENKEDPVLLGGKYEIPRDTGVLCLLSKIQRDPKVWGEDADEFKPERMLDEHFNKLPKNAWKPFGTGLRSCIGRAFAWQEALMVTALLLQNFNLALEDPNYTMRVQQSLTIKPRDSWVRATLRPGITATSLQERLTGSPAAPHAPGHAAAEHNGTAQDAAPEGPPMTILYGSNTGTCQALAQNLASDAASRGFSVSVKDLDSAVEAVPKDQPVVIITASYEGQPPDNAARFVAWLESVKDETAFGGVRFAVFGCGHTDWAATYQRIPWLVDSLLAEHGAARIAERGLTDAAKRDMFGDFAKWADETLLPKLLPSVVDDADSKSGSSGTGGAAATKPQPRAPPQMELSISTDQRASHLRQKLYWANVTEARVLTAPGEPEKRHIEFELPSDMTYQAGDYLAVLPLNPDETVRRVIRRFRLPWDAVVTIKKGGPTTLPTGEPISAYELLRGYVELSQPATQKDVQALVEVAADAAEKARLEALLLDRATFERKVLDRRTSVLDLLEQNASAALPLARFLCMLPPLSPRHYSISSSPLAQPRSCTLTYSVIDAPTWSDSGDTDTSGSGSGNNSGGRGRRRFHGVAGTYLKSLQEGDQALVAVRSTNKFFRLPPSPEHTPLLMFCAGSGLAPFRGFLQERAVLMREGGRRLAPALLFVGCRDPVADRLYGEEVDGWVREGVVDVRYAFSRRPEDPRAGPGCARVPDRLLKDREDVFRLWDAGAKVFSCGSKEFAAGLHRAARAVILERARAEEAGKKGKEEGGKGGGVEVTEEMVDEWIRERRNERFVSDVFS